MNRLLTFAAGLIVIGMIGYFLIIASSIIIPLVVAVFIWHLLNTIGAAIQRIPVLGILLPYWLSMVLAFVLFILFISLFMDIITSNVSNVIAASSRYQENLFNIFANIDHHFNIKILSSINSLIKTLSVQTVIINIYGMFTKIASSTILITLYVVFLFVEQHFFREKMEALFPSLESRLLVNNILTHIVIDTQTYLGIKTLLSGSTAITSWLIMKYIGLDFAEFWALLIFFLNYIPNIGAIVAIVFPALLALLQFPDWFPFIIITLGLALIQFIVGNVIEPRFIGKSLNLSPLVILFSLALWGAIWGVLGMFLSVPITVMMMIIFAHFEKTRPVAILLSQDGHIFKSYEILPDENTSDRDWVLY